MLASKRNGALHIGVTSHLIQRIWQRKNDLASGFTAEHNVHMRVYFGQRETMESAVIREKQLKKWNRQWKIDLIEKENPQWNDLWDYIQ
ncbi:MULTISPECIES: GIY-YIG nuclease family protein [unclassified Endozoicomonas]|uniref:GIY-YIG nuclease family protein n=1 Tax=unclassified Endozoicomonas TaxID=2644528 RepID=UPI0021482B85